MKIDHNNIDLINGLFEITAGLLQIINLVKIATEKQVKGVSVIPVIFFTLWGIFNLLFYSNLELAMSFYGGLVITSTNISWIVLYFKYKTRK